MGGARTQYEVALAQLASGKNVDRTRLAFLARNAEDEQKFEQRQSSQSGSQSIVPSISSPPAEARSSSNPDPWASIEESTNEVAASILELQKTIEQRARARKAETPQPAQSASAPEDFIARSVCDGLAAVSKHINLVTGTWKIEQRKDSDLHDVVCSLADAIFRRTNAQGKMYQPEIPPEIRENMHYLVCKSLVWHPVVVDFYRTFPDEAHRCFAYAWSFVYVGDKVPVDWDTHHSAINYFTGDGLRAARAYREFLKRVPD